MAPSDLNARLQAALGDAYVVERELTGGGMSRLFLATERSLDRKVVVKLLPPELASEVSAARFKREMDLAAHLQHPHILPILGAGSADGLLYYLMPYVEGESLRHRLTDAGRLPIAQAVLILQEVADALAFAHERGIVHRDIKPENILLQAGHAVVTDFGIARALSGTSAGNLTGTGISIGTPGYMAPEQAVGDPTVDARADVYALGVVGYEMFTGRTPFDGPSVQAIVKAHLTEVPKPLATVAPGVPRRMADAIMRALAKAPDERFASAREFVQYCGTVAVVPAGRRPVSTGTVATAATAVVLLLGALLLRGRSTHAMDPNVVAVAPFDILAPELSLWHDGMVDVLSRNLDGMGPLRTISPSVVIKGFHGRADAASAVALGRRTDARYVVIGRLEQVGTDSVRAVVNVVDVTRGRAGQDVELREAESSMDRLGDSLAVRLVRNLPATAGLANLRLSSLGTRSLPALKAFLRAESFFRRSEWDSAAAYYGNAIAQDSGFAIAWAGLGLTSGWSTNIANANTAASQLRAGALNHGLGRRDSILVLVDSLIVAAQITLPSPAAWNHLRRLYATIDSGVRLYPRDPVAWYAYGDVRFHFPRAPGIWSSDRDALADFDSSLVLDSTASPVYTHPVELALELGDIARARRYLASAIAQVPTGPGRLRLDITRAFIGFDGGPRLPAILDTVDRLDVELASVPVRARADSVEVLARLGAEWLARPGYLMGSTAARMQRRMEELLGYRGHVRAAMAIPGAEDMPDFSSLMLLDAIPADSARAAMARRFAKLSSVSNEGDVVYWASIGDTARVRGVADSVRIVMSADSGLPPWLLRYFQMETQSLLALARGDSADALRQLDAVPDSLCIGCGGPINYVHARLLAAVGRDRDAYNLLSVRDEDMIASALVVPRTLELARVAERLGKAREAVDAYAFVVAAWDRADPELAQIVKEASAALRRLAGDRAHPGH